MILTKDDLYEIGQRYLKSNRVRVETVISTGLVVSPSNNPITELIPGKQFVYVVKGFANGRKNLPASELDFRFYFSGVEIIAALSGEGNETVQINSSLDGLFVDDLNINVANYFDYYLVGFLVTSY